MNHARFRLTRLALLAAGSSILMYWQLPLPFLPPFLTLDASDVPALLAALFFGLPAGIAVLFVKNIFHLLISSSLGIGEVANFLLMTLYLLVAYVLRSHRLRYAAATLALAVGACVLNLFVLLPLYQAAFGITTEQLLALTRAAGNNVVTVWDFLCWVIFPFNLLKGALIALLTRPIYRRLRRHPLFCEK